MVFLALFALFWLLHFIGCLRRKDFGTADKIFWFIILIIPVAGLILYRGIGNEFYKKSSRDVS